ncbi:MAG: hypothetical protein Q9207_002341 [Kuettlingeria erythrocarpa]
MNSPIVAIVTGANRGIGEGICQVLASTNQQPMVLYAASRRGQDLDLKPASSKTTLRYRKLDIADPSSVQTFAKTIQADHSHVDVLINNAGVNLDMEYSPQNVKTTLDTNYRGTLNMCQTFIPLLSKDGRIVNVSSTGSSLSGYSKEIQDRFRNPKMRLDDLEQMMNEYQVIPPRPNDLGQDALKLVKEAANNDTEELHGWKRQAYGATKAAENAITAVLAREHPGLIINACCPGWVDTDMGALMGRPPKTPGTNTLPPHVPRKFQSLTRKLIKLMGPRSQ